MVVVADTTPLNYLIQIGVVEILPRRFGSIIVPDAALLEMRHVSAPAAVHQFAQQLPPWVLAQTATLIPEITGLGAGEREAIALGLELKADYLLMDDLAARDEASRRGLICVGTLGLLADAHRRDWLAFDN